MCFKQTWSKKVERKHTELEKIFINQLSNKEFVSRIYKEFLQLGNKKQITQLIKWGKDLMWIDTSPKKIYKKPKPTWKDVQY